MAIWTVKFHPLVIAKINVPLWAWIYGESTLKKETGSPTKTENSNSGGSASIGG